MRITIFQSQKKNVMKKNTNKILVRNNKTKREFLLTPSELDLWTKGKINFTVIKAPALKEEIPDVLKVEEDLIN